VAHILLIEDEELSRKTVRRFLESAGHQVTEAENGEVGLRLREAIEFDLVITDIVMPVVEGISTITELRANYPGQKIITITGGGAYPQTKDMYADMATKLGTDEALLKPFTEDELLAAVDRCLGAVSC